MPGERGDLRAAYAVAWLRGADDPQFVVLEAEDVERIRECAQNTDDNSSPWVQFPDAMWRKSAAIQLCKFLPMAVEAAEAVSLDELSTAGKSQDLALKSFGYDEQQKIAQQPTGNIIDLDDLKPSGEYETVADGNGKGSKTKGSKQAQQEAETFPTEE